MGPPEGTADPVTEAGDGTAAGEDGPEAVVRAFLAALTGPRPAESTALLSPDVEWVNGSSGHPVGHRAVLEEVRPVLEASDEADWVITAAAASGGTVFLERRDRFRRGEVWVEVPVVGVFEVERGRIVRWRDYFDSADGGERLAPLWA